MFSMRKDFATRIWDYSTGFGASQCYRVLEAERLPRFTTHGRRDKGSGALFRSVGGHVRIS